MSISEKKKAKKEKAEKINKAMGAAAKANIRNKQEHMANMKKIEKEMAAKVQKELMKESSAGAGEQTIIMPEYEWDKELSVFREIDIPNKKLFLPVGYNS